MLRWVPVLAIAAAFAACDAGDRQPLTGPDGSGPARVLGLGGSAGYTVVKERRATVGTVTGVIGPEGGRLLLGRHELRVPAGAVGAPATFSLTRLSATELKFGLAATRVLPNDVGSRGFAAPVKLVVDFREAEVSDPSVLQVLWAKLDGSVEAQPTQVDVYGKKATGDLTHFSDYMLAVP